MASLSLNSIVLDTDSASSSQSGLSNLDSTLLSDTNSSGESDTLSSQNSSNPVRKKRKLRAKTTWSYARLPKGDEEERNSAGRRYFYCKLCPNFREVITSNMRSHLQNQHGIIIKLQRRTSALDWWLELSNRTSFPCLYRMPIDILSISPMSAEPQRIFSGARRTITWTRMRLGPLNIERNECLKSWIRTGLVAGWRKELIMKTDARIGGVGSLEGGQEYEFEDDS